MNAGSTETGLWDRTIWADALMPSGERVRLTAAEAAPAYRSVGLPDAWVFVAARFAALPGDPDRIQAAHADRRRRKVATQVYELPSCGSIWKNPGPPHGSAWELVDRAGMRGAVRGGARITERHANFIANTGGATAADVLWLMSETRRRVHVEAGVWLEPEIRLWGFDEGELASVGGAA
jgi:UDP-N-acetylmuramate dehydrogenase